MNQAAKIAEPEQSPDQKSLLYFFWSFGGWLVMKSVMWTIQIH